MTPEQQTCLMLHGTRQLFIRQQTSVINVIRAHLAELGIVAPIGRKGVEELLDVIADRSDERLPEVARTCLIALGVQLRSQKAQILEFDRMIAAWHRSNEVSRRLDLVVLRLHGLLPRERKQSALPVVGFAHELVSRGRLIESFSFPLRVGRA